MFKIKRKYKINTNKGRFYTGEILEEDDIFISIKDKYGDTVGIKKDDIAEFKELD